MGMYTQFFLQVELKDLLPREVLRILQFMTDKSVYKTESRLYVPDHKFFQTKQWPYMLTCDSAYFAHEANSRVHLHHDRWILNVDCDFKNDDNEASLFVDWLLPYVVGYPNELIGFTRCETVLEPTLIYMPDSEDL